MITKTVFLASLDTGNLLFGYVGENNHIQYDIRCDSVFDAYPDAEVTLNIKAPDGTVYPKDVTKDSPSVLLTIANTDTAINGNGQLQLTFTNAGEVIKTVIAGTVILPSLVGNNPPPSPVEDWIAQAEDIVKRSEALMSVVTIPGTASGAMASFSDGAKNIPLTSLIAEINPVQAGTGDPSPTNIRYITGRTGLKAYVRGKNLVDDSIKYAANTTTIYIGNENEYVIPLKAGTYTLSITFSDSKHYGAYYREENDDSNTTVWTSSSATTSATITLTKDGLYKFWLYHADGVSVDYITSVMLEAGSTATTYAPYAGAEYQVSWQDEAGTIYGGMLNVVTGLLTVTKAMVTIDGGTGETYLDVTSANAFYVTKDGIDLLAASDGTSEYCSMFKPIQAANTQSMTDGTIARQGTGTKRLFVKSSVFAGYTKEQLAAYFAQHNFQYVGKLITPLTYQLDHVEVKTLLQLNNIWADTGNVAVEYTADTKTYIDTRIAELQALILEN